MSAAKVPKSIPDSASADSVASSPGGAARATATVYACVVSPSAAVTVAVTVVVSPAPSPTWWPGAASASGGAIATDAPASVGTAVTVVSATAWSTSAA